MVGRIMVGFVRFFGEGAVGSECNRDLEVRRLFLPELFTMVSRDMVMWCW